MKIGIYTDTLAIKGGGTKAVIELANQLNADIITAGFNPQINHWLKINNEVIDLGNLTLKWNHSLGYLIEAPLRFLLNKKNLNYDVHIFTGVSSFFAAKKTNKNIWLCFSPNRILYDLYEWKVSNDIFIKRTFFKFYSFILRPLDQKYIKDNISLVVPQTKIVLDRVSKYYGINSAIINTSVNTSKYRFNKFGDFFLTVSRLMSEKRIPLIIEAFKEMPDKKLVIVGSGPERNKIVESIREYDNIKLLENLEEDKLLDLYANCLATIYMPMDEDYGLVPIEGMASGKPCIAVNEGGCRETVLDQKTGLLISPDKNSIIKAVNEMDIATAMKMKRGCIEQAQKFDTALITAQWKQLLNKQIQSI